MNAEEIRKKAIECGENLKTMCISNTTIDRNFNAKCADNCEYTGLERCGAVYGYEHGFADGVEEGKKQSVLSKLDIDEQYEVSKEIEADIRADAYEDFLKILNEIHRWVWDIDIPSPTCPEHIEHHKDCLELMEKISEKINYCYGKLKEQTKGEEK